MSLIKWNAEPALFPTISSWMDDFFADNDGGWFKPAVRGVSIPAVNVKESKKAFTLEVGAPGFQKDDFKIEIKNGCLMVSGENKSEKEETEENFTRREFSYNTFTRSFTLPENVQPDNIEAKYDAGILRVTLPKSTTEEKAVKTVKVG